MKLPIHKYKYKLHCSGCYNINKITHEDLYQYFAIINNDLFILYYIIRKLFYKL